MIRIADPALAKSVNPKEVEIGEMVVFTIWVTNYGNIDADNVVVTDPLPNYLDVLDVTTTKGTITILGRTVIVDIGTVAPGELITIKIRARVNEKGKPPGGKNIVTLETTSLTDVVTNNTDSASFLIPSPEDLPNTGFAPGQETILPPQPEESAYAEYDGLWLEVPALGIEMPIVGVPLTSEGWNVDWLGGNAGYLEGTAFPTWAGNTGIAGHVYLPNGLPGPFVNLEGLSFGDQIIIHAWGQRYVYEVRIVDYVRPDDLSVLGHEQYDWVTLITCRNYDEDLGAYRWRVVVQAVLVSVEADGQTGAGQTTLTAQIPMYVRDEEFVF